MTEPLRILFVEDIPYDMELAGIELQKAGIPVTAMRVDKRKELLRALPSFLPRLVICDYSMPGFDGMEALTIIKRYDVTLPVIIFTGSQNEMVAVECMKAGASDYILKDNITRLPFAVLEALEKKQLQKDKAQAELELLEENQKLNAYLDLAGSMVLVLAPDASIRMINRKGCELLGYTPVELIGKNWYDCCIPASIRETMKQRCTEIFRKEIELPAYFENPVVTRKGEERLIGWHNVLLRDAAGTPYATMSVCDDITEQVAARQAALNLLEDLHLEVEERRRVEEQLRTSEMKYRQLFESMAQGAFYQDASGNLTDVNAAALGMFGLSREEFLGRTSLRPGWNVIREDGSLIPGEEHPSMIALKTGKPVKEMIVGVLRPIEQTYTWMIVNAVPEFRPGEKKPYRVAVTLHDITRIRKAEGLLKESKERFEQVAEYAVEWIWEVDAKGLYTYSNMVVEKILGFSPGEIVGKKHFYDLFVPGERKSMKQAALETFSKRESFRNFVNRNLHRDGHVVILETSGSPVLDPEGNLLGYRGSDNDITEWTLSEERLRDSEEKYRQLTELTPDGILVHVDGHIVYANPAAAALLKCGDPEEMKGMPLLDFVHPDFKGTVKKRVNQVTFQKEAVPAIEELLLCKDGTVIVAEVSAIPFPHEGKSAVQVVFTDITARKQVEDALKQKIDELERFNDLTVGREMMMMHLKREVNELLGRLGEQEKYRIVE